MAGDICIYINIAFPKTILFHKSIYNISIARHEVTLPQVPQHLVMLIQEIPDRHQCQSHVCETVNVSKYSTNYQHEEVFIQKFINFNCNTHPSSVDLQIKGC